MLGLCRYDMGKLHLRINAGTKHQIKFFIEHNLCYFWSSISFILRTFSFKIQYLMRYLRKTTWNYTFCSLGKSAQPLYYTGLLVCCLGGNKYKVTEFQLAGVVSQQCQLSWTTEYVKLKAENRFWIIGITLYRGLPSDKWPSTSIK